MLFGGNEPDSSKALPKPNFHDVMTQTPEPRKNRHLMLERNSPRNREFLQPTVPRWTRELAGCALRRIRAKLQALHSAWAQFATRKVALNDLLLGPEGGIAPMRWAEATGDYSRLSLPLASSPHVHLLREYARVGNHILTPENLRNTEYFRNAQQCIAMMGSYCGQTDPEGILLQAHTFIDRYLTLGRAPSEIIDFCLANQDPPRSAPPIVKATFSRTVHQIVAGHHELAAAYVAGYKQARVNCLPASPTPLQSLVMQVSQTDGRRELYQEIETPEFDDSWHVVRRCRTRLQMMLRFLRERGYPFSKLSVLDLACSYGWFVAEFAKLGCVSFGVERDPKALRIGQVAYGLQPEQIVAADLRSFLGENNRTFDVVLFLSVLHHYALGCQQPRPVEMIRALDAVTGSCLFLDTGERHEHWYKDSLREWSPAYISDFVKSHTSLRNVVPLGVDADSRGPYRKNYGRTLFACFR